MAGLSEQVWVLLAVVAGVGVLSLLHFMACAVHNTTYVHDMRVRVATLRKEQVEHLQALADAADRAQRESLAFAATNERKAA